MRRPAIHPGEILGDELTELSQQINVPPNRVTQIFALTIPGTRSLRGARLHTQIVNATAEALNVCVEASRQGHPRA